MEKEQFTFEGKNYEVRIESDSETITIRVFHQGEPANGYTYQVRVPTYYDLKKVMGFDAIKNLIETAKNDVINSNYDRFLKALESINK